MYPSVKSSISTLGTNDLWHNMELSAFCNLFLTITHELQPWGPLTHFLMHRWRDTLGGLTIDCLKEKFCTNDI